MSRNVIFVQIILFPFVFCVIVVSWFLSLRPKYSSNELLTEQAVLSGDASELNFGKFSVLTSIGTPIIITEILHVFSQFLLENTEQIPRSGSDNFLLQFFHSVIAHHLIF
jgi:hypothetical protein